MTVYAITDTKKGRTGIAPTYLQTTHGILTPCNVATGMWLWNRDSEFTNWQHPAVWYVALGWHATEFTQTRPPYWNSTSGFHFHTSPAVDMSLCTSLRNFIQIGPPSAEKMTSCRFSRWRISAILDYMDPIMGSLKSPVKLTYRKTSDRSPRLLLVQFTLTPGLYPGPGV